MKKVAQEIIRQLGGTGRLSALVGAHTFVYEQNKKGETIVSFKIKASPIVNLIKITYTVLDTYTVECIKYKDLDIKVISKKEDVYEDNLLDILEEACKCYFTLHSRV